MSIAIEEKEKSLTIDQTYGGFLYTETIPNSNETSIVNVNSNS